MYTYMLISTKKVRSIKISQIVINDVANIPGISDRVTLYERMMNNNDHVKYCLYEPKLRTNQNGQSEVYKS